MSRSGRAMVGSSHARGLNHAHFIVPRNRRLGPHRPQHPSGGGGRCRPRTHRTTPAPMQQIQKTSRGVQMLRWPVQISLGCRRRSRRKTVLVRPNALIMCLCEVRSQSSAATSLAILGRQVSPLGHVVRMRRCRTRPKLLLRSVFLHQIRPSVLGLK